ncbi:MAG TPA: hypothetical protein P5026_07790 [Kiritimatiellia bacterium]|nr:hypothetical protein [Kiritimatiellia bacterium]HRU70192.1 hypothetical protein [Kiritimatiellia bacterium]
MIKEGRMTQAAAKDLAEREDAAVRAAVEYSVWASAVAAQMQHAGSSISLVEEGIEKGVAAAAEELVRRHGLEGVPLDVSLNVRVDRFALTPVWRVQRLSGVGTAGGGTLDECMRRVAELSATERLRLEAGRMREAAERLRERADEWDRRADDEDARAKEGGGE